MEKNHLRTFMLLFICRNWYTDEPSCGSEKCVVMYHQPTANPGLGGPYLYQWNDDRCNMKHNYICKYEPGRKLTRTSTLRYSIPFGSWFSSIKFAFPLQPVGSLNIPKHIISIELPHALNRKKKLKLSGEVLLI